MKPKTVAIVQARMGSSRFPGKVLADIAGQPMLARVLDRLRLATLIDHTLVATSTLPADDPIAEFCRRYDVDCFRGAESDVLDRFYQAARIAQADAIVRITADCPLLDPAVIDNVVRTFYSSQFDYVTNVLRYTYPDGLDTEVFSFHALQTAWKHATLPSEREHVTTYIRSSGQFKIANVENTTDLSPRQWRWTVDTPADLEFVCQIYSRLGQANPRFHLDDIVALLEKHPEMTQLNSNLVRNQGYYRSLLNEPPLPPLQRSLAQSQFLLNQAKRLIPSCTQTFSKGPTQFVQGAAPTFIVRGQGSHVWDPDGNEYIDYPMALAPVILGHNDPDVTAAASHQLQLGTTYSLPHPLEIEVAQLLTELIPCAQMVRFGKNGSDATSGAVRAARAFTGRDLIACCGYHGWQDWYIGTTTRSKGVPQPVRQLTRPFLYNDLPSLERIFAEHPAQIAAVIMEPVGVVDPQPGFLQHVKELTHANGALLIFDEIVTGFRLARGGAQEYYGVIPDLACCGKAMANGFPLAAVVGRKDVMAIFDEIFFSFTFGGETVSLAAAKATLLKIKNLKVIPHLWEQGQRLKDGFNVLAQQLDLASYTKCIGLPPRTVVTFHDEKGAESTLLKSYFQQECLKRGVLFSGGHNISLSHSPTDIDQTLRVYRTALELLAKAVRAGNAAQLLDGPPVQPVFRRA